jgi:hypothetical protein
MISDWVGKKSRETSGSGVDEAIQMIDRVCVVM